MKTNYSAQRQLILSTIKSVKTHPSAKSIFEMCKEKNPNIGFATVYRNLELFEKNRDIVKVAGTIGGERYDGDTSLHNHIICPKCGDVMDLECSESLSKILQDEMKSKDFVGCSLTFYKECDKCKNKN